MCEIAILDPDEYSTLELTEISIQLFNTQGSSLGVVAIYDEGDHFEYGIYEDVSPDPDELSDFFEENDADNVNRVIIHGRMATCGDVCEENAHPLEVDCPECDVDYVLHNGIVSMHRRDRNQHQQEGHEYNTDVDSETIAHNFGYVPDDPDEKIPTHHDREPAFILMNDQAVFIFASSYHLTPDAIMARYRREFAPEYKRANYDRVIMTPSEE